MCVPRDLLGLRPMPPMRAEITATKEGEKHSNIFVFFPGLLAIK